MQDFIEVTVYETGHKMLVRVSEIKFVEELKNRTKIIMAIAQGQYETAYVYTQNSYSEVIDKIREASKSD